MGRDPWQGLINSSRSYVLVRGGFHRTCKDPFTCLENPIPTVASWPEFAIETNTVKADEFYESMYRRTNATRTC